jgi:hypothetical protein
MPIWDIHGTVPPTGGTPTGKAKRPMVPARTNMSAATIRVTARSCGAQVAHFATTFDAVMRHASASESRPAGRVPPSEIAGAARRSASICRGGPR